MGAKKWILEQRQKAFHDGWSAGISLPPSEIVVEPQLYAELLTSADPCVGVIEGALMFQGVPVVAAA